MLPACCYGWKYRHIWVTDWFNGTTAKTNFAPFHSSLPNCQPEAMKLINEAISGRTWMDSCLQSGTFKFSMERSSSRLDICFTMSKPSAAVPLRVLPCNLYREVSYFHISCAYHCHGDNNADHPNPIRANFLSSPLLSYLSYPAKVSPPQAIIASTASSCSLSSCSTSAFSFGRFLIYFCLTLKIDEDG